ncbi:uncharacterized protein LOC100938089 isoform X7 [Pongo abelii]|uniref:uncharacterized protein LOC100938089 isoform X7 n=1 Tax=Pongo abelii TaxID=9601 RepID=UPI0030040B2C
MERLKHREVTESAQDCKPAGGRASFQWNEGHVHSPGGPAKPLEPMAAHILPCQLLLSWATLAACCGSPWDGQLAQKGGLKCVLPLELRCPSAFPECCWVQAQRSVRTSPALGMTPVAAPDAGHSGTRNKEMSHKRTPQPTAPVLKSLRHSHGGTAIRQRTTHRDLMFSSTRGTTFPVASPGQNKKK